MISDRFDHLASVIVKDLGVKPRLVGKGDQSWIFSYKPGKVIKVYRKEGKEYLKSLADFEDLLSQYKLPFEFPRIYEIGSKNGLFYTIEKELKGKTLGSIFAKLSKSEKANVLTRYLDVLKYFQNIELDQFDFGQVLKTDEEIRASTWAEFLERKLMQRIQLVKTHLQKDVRRLEEKINLMKRIFKSKLRFPEKKLVHGDYFYNNILFDEDLNVSGVFDFSNSTVVGDYRMDIACGIMYFDLDSSWNDFLLHLAVSEYGEGILPIIRYYTAYQAFFQTESYFYNKGLYAWCLNHLNSDELWEFISR